MPVVLDDLSFYQSVVNQPVTKCDINPVTALGDNIASDLSAITLHTPTGQMKLIHKRLADNEIKGPAIEYQFFRKEAAFYKFAIPKIESVVNQRLSQCQNGSSQSYAFPGPKVYAAFNNDQDDYLIIEDVRPGGYRMPNKCSGLNLDEVKLVLEELAKFHAYTYMMIRQEGEEIFDDKKGGDMSIFKQSFWADSKYRQDATFIAEGSYRIALPLVSNPEYRTRLQNLFPSENDLYDRFVIPFTWTASQVFPVMVLGDCWVNNIMLKYDEQKRPVGLKFLDFQLARRGNIFEELLYFIYTSTTSAFRKRYLDEVLQYYFARFERTLAGVNFPMPANFTTEGFRALFQRGRFSAFMFMCFAIPIQLGNHKASVKNDKEEEAEEENGDVEKAISDMMTRATMRLSKSPEALQRLNDIVAEMFEENLV